MSYAQLSIDRERERERELETEQRDKGRWCNYSVTASIKGLL